MLSKLWLEMASTPREALNTLQQGGYWRGTHGGTDQRWSGWNRGFYLPTFTSKRQIIASILGCLAIPSRRVRFLLRLLLLLQDKRRLSMVAIQRERKVYHGLHQPFQRDAREVQPRGLGRVHHLASLSNLFMMSIRNYLDMIRAHHFGGYLDILSVVGLE